MSPEVWGRAEEGFTLNVKEEGEFKQTKAIVFAWEGEVVSDGPRVIVKPEEDRVAASLLSVSVNAHEKDGPAQVSGTHTVLNGSSPEFTPTGTWIKPGGSVELGDRVTIHHSPFKIS